jgi:hypothetical protein
MGEAVRACRRTDMDAVANMFARVLLKQRQPASQGLTDYFEQIVFAEGEDDASARSRVFVDADGDVRGFIGVWPRRMLLRGRTIEAAAAGSLMVDHPERHPTAGARLLRSFLNGPQDLSFSETANDVSQRMWEKAGGERLPTSSLDWLRVFRPAGFAVSVAGSAFRPAGLLRPVAAGLDRMLDASGRNPMQLVANGAAFSDADASSDEIADLIPQLSAAYALHPDWQTPGLPYLLAHAEAKERYGKAYRRVVRDRSGRPCGCYLYYARAGGVARVLQVMALRNTVDITLDSLFRHAAEIGCVGVRGRVEPDLLDALVARRCLLFHVSATVVHARDKELLAEVRRAPGLMSGLAGESWNRLIGGEFV